uniref:Peptidase M14 domain-containing protein n=2 Tax=Guillardia theta TaxID=55529 RepID=A0A7S4NYK6_GUITH|mmetsp:Transcript_38957/g.122913  ORF Transcript_38957/g.122913 Transcript_38957/m.122913 type:complete len:428 (+) Transcript_38957:277-1560(+)
MHISCNNQFAQLSLLDCFASNFENGNLDAARETVPQAEWDLEIRGDTNNSKYRVWFYFAVSNVKNKQVCIFNVINFSKGRSLYREGMTPLVRSTKRTHWQRIPSRNSFYYKSPKHKMNYVLSFIFEFDNEDEEYFFAYSFPYTYSDLQKYLYQIESRKLSFCKRELLCKTILQRRVDLLVIGKDPRGTRNSLSQIESRRGERRRVVFVSARVHPGESPASYMCHGLIEFLLSSTPLAQLLRKHITFMIVPMLNPDGVFLGNYRTAFCGLDLNRQWANPAEWLVPENYHVKSLIKELADDPWISLDFVIDMHAHSTSMNAFCFVNLVADDSRDISRMQDELTFLRLMSINCKMFSLNSSRICCDPSKLGTGRRELPQVVQDHTHCYTLEASFFCYQNVGCRPTPFTQQTLIEVGRDAGITFLDYYRLR